MLLSKPEALSAGALWGAGFVGAGGVSANEVALWPVRVGVIGVLAATQSKWSGLIVDPTSIATQPTSVLAGADRAGLSIAHRDAGRVVLSPDQLTMGVHGRMRETLVRAHPPAAPAIVSSSLAFLCHRFVARRQLPRRIPRLTTRAYLPEVPGSHPPPGLMRKRQPPHMPSVSLRQSRKAGRSPNRLSLLSGTRQDSHVVRLLEERTGRHEHSTIETTSSYCEE
jgi:hypothetical protein